MAKKRTSLDALNLEPEAPVEETIAAPPKTQAAPEKTVIKQTAYLPQPVHEQLRRLAFEERAKMHDYLMEGLDRVFAQRGLPSIDQLKQNGQPL